MKKYLVLLVLACLALTKTMAQDSLAVDHESDSLIVESQDTVMLKTYAARYNPRKALLYAAVVPGLGQIYNKKYWKLPLVYGGFIALGYAINFYQEGYIKYKNKLFFNLDHGYDGDSEIYPGDVYTTSTYRNVVDQYRRQRDFMIVIAGGVYILQMVDALVDAHLKEFDLNPSLKVTWHPSVEQNALIGRTSGVTLLVKF
ncbi:DUF5683 domain-containing protein [Chryseolinea soli]|uniref:DUF5683 domain-containing protein n=1 Tax=Chryseolinea soli TaxID=2321403 RepID=A0A385SU86_9BACT|nr:DUF5683 domain-containing protein [Chryseolinea soli]AYB33697.1 hypothetical protein D4L85_25330 [Chryseolinea soli]